MHDEGHQVHVGLRSSPTTLLTERLFLAETQQQQLEVMHVEAVVQVSYASALLQVVVMSVGKYTRQNLVLTFLRTFF